MSAFITHSNHINLSQTINFTTFQIERACSDHFGPIVHENMTYGPKWPVKIRNGAKFYPDCAKIEKVIFQFLIQACCEKLSGENIYTRTVFIYTRLESICLSFNMSIEIMDKVSYQLVDAYPAKI